MDKGPIWQKSISEIHNLWNQGVYHFGFERLAFGNSLALPTYPQVISGAASLAQMLINRFQSLALLGPYKMTHSFQLLMLYACITEFAFCTYIKL